MDSMSIQKVLVAIDGSKRSIETVKYIAGLRALRDAEIHLFNVFHHIPESHYDLAREPASSNMMSSLISWEQNQRKQIEKYMKRCRDILLAADFHPQRVKTMINKRRAGVARDIIAMTEKDYDAVVIRRRGMTKLAGIVMGSVAFKLLDGVRSVPLVFAGRKPDNGRILIGMDLSENAIRAVDFAGRMMQGADCRVGLATVLRKESCPDNGNGRDGQGVGSSWEAEYEAAVHNAFDRAVSSLASYGFDREKISTEIIKGARSRAGALVELAEKEAYNTIVIGRKGVSSLNDFLIGRVSRKILYVGKKHNVWIVN